MTEREQRARGRRFVWRDGDFVAVKRGERVAPRKIDQQVGAGPGFELGQIRRARNMTQTELAGAMGIDQAEVSRLERRDDVHVSTVLNYLNSLDVAELEVTLTFRDGTEMVLPVDLESAGRR